MLYARCVQIVKRVTLNILAGIAVNIESGFFHKSIKMRDLLLNLGTYVNTHKNIFLFKRQQKFSIRDFYRLTYFCNSQFWLLKYY